MGHEIYAVQRYCKASWFWGLLQKSVSNFQDVDFLKNGIETI